MCVLHLMEGLCATANASYRPRSQHPGPWSTWVYRHSQRACSTADRAPPAHHRLLTLAVYEKRRMSLKVASAASGVVTGLWRQGMFAGRATPHQCHQAGPSRPPLSRVRPTWWHAQSLRRLIPPPESCVVISKLPRPLPSRTKDRRWSRIERLHYGTQTATRHPNPLGQLRGGSGLFRNGGQSRPGAVLHSDNLRMR